MDTINMTNYETPDALRHDANRLVNEARSLLEATAEITDNKVTAARQRLAEALDAGQNAFFRLQDKAIEGTRAADRAVHEHPYPTIVTAFGIGALLAILLSRRG
jgi:ElaB/YqjD/DUF883 family membrane-anchored ribosome-binding protein